MARRIRRSRADIQRWTQMVSCLRLMNIAFTNVRIYPANHPEVAGTLVKLHKLVNPLVEELEDIGFGFMDELLYLEGAMSLEETAGNQMLVDRFTRCRVKYLTFTKGITVEDLAVFFQVLNAEANTPSKERPREILEEKGVRTIHIVEAETAELAGKGRFAKKKTLLDWYEKAVTTYKITVDQYKQGLPVDFKLLYRHIDDMTATIKNKGHEPYLLLPVLGKGLDAHACHSVNVSVLACALGGMYGLNTGQINTLSICAFLHDLGRLIIPVAWTERKRPLTRDERAMAQQHPVWGSLFLLCKTELPPQMGVLADRHHSAPSLAADGGYVPDIFHKIIAAADYYDLALISDKYYWNKHRQDRVLHKMLNRRGKQFDPTILKLLANCVGFYPAGSLVLLKDGRKGIVVRSNSAHFARPKVYLYESDKLPGEVFEQTQTPESSLAATEAPPPPMLDLAELNAAGTGFGNSIVRVLSPSGTADVQMLLSRRKEFFLGHTL